MEVSPQRNRLRVISAALLIAALSFGVGFLARGFFGGNSTTSPASTLAPTGVDVGPLWKVWATLDEKFVPTSATSTVSRQEMLWGAAEGLASSLKDPYTVFLPPEDAKIFEDDIQGSFGGVGMEIGLRDKEVTVIAPLKGTPAERAGILPGDKVLRIDSTPTAGMGVDRAIKLIRGEIGTTVVLLLSREGGEPFEVSVVRAAIEVPTISTEKRADGVFVIRLYNFSAISPNLFRDALRQFVNAGTPLLILDLRGNPGGYLEAAVDMASFFLPAGKVVVKEQFGEGTDPRIHRSRGYNVFNENLRMVILVNQGSASASEILAGALQEHEKAVLVGERTFGKGSVQELVSITDDSSLKVTIARWLTPKDRSISDGGLTPNVEVLVTKEDVESSRDPQLERAVSYLLGASAGTAVNQ